ncbi:cytochrome b [Oleiagrimonas sp.]|jgi:cytochrome b561|uniref:cytochrome b n=1 Tax=Oleiagrimonas sp. TaxID=2010330 RepID=UPI00262BF4BC|nr:cytochrome b [Oleiagrimonas sp.]MDA3912680.1 cytochrome b [Oleiagrimonas sp.]
MKKTSRYGFWHRNLHWVIATLVIGALALVELHDYAPRGSALRSDMMYWHMQFGLAVLILFVPRLIVRLTGGRPAIVPPLAWWQSIPARLVHWVFYLLMIGQPIVGLLMVQAGNHNPGFWGLSLPQFVAPDKALSKQLGNIHVIAGNVFLWLVIIHALIALWHHWGRKDNTLRRMIYSK